ncbi:MAG: hypothetical protein H6Q84_1271 [Deltaproteobacteria bacterium]|nr:hypothetical protein [Deltaproteobacteria bacterium]
MKPPAWILAIAAFLFAGTAFAADSEFRIEPYLWVAGLTGTIGTPTSGPGLPEGGRIDATFGNLSENLELAGGGMIAVDYRRNRWSVFGDWTYAHVKSEAPSPLGQLFSSVEGDLKGHIVQGAAGYQLYGGDRWRVEAYAGARYYNLDLQLELRPGTLAGRVSQADPDWVDGLVGARYQGLLGDHWAFALQGDVGTGGSDVSWQGIASLGYRVSWGTIVGGWRYLKVDYEDGDTKMDLALSGPFFGVIFRF